MGELTPTGASILGFLESGPKAGWDIAAEAEASIGDFWNVTRSHLYRELRRLQDQGLVERGTPGPRDRTPYEITDSGRQAFRGWLGEGTDPDIIRSPFQLKMFFGSHLDHHQLAAIVDLHRARTQANLDRYQRLAESLPDADAPQTRMLQFGTIYCEVLLRWLDDLPWGRTAGSE